MMAERAEHAANRAGTSAYLAIVRQIMAMQGRGITSQVDQSGFAIAHYAAARGETTVLRFLASMGGRCGMSWGWVGCLGCASKKASLANVRGAFHF